MMKTLSDKGGESKFWETRFCVMRENDLVGEPLGEIGGDLTFFRYSPKKAFNYIVW